MKNQIVDLQASCMRHAHAAQTVQKKLYWLRQRERLYTAYLAHLERKKLADGWVRAITGQDGGRFERALRSITR